MIFVDTNVLVDLAAEAGPWGRWSAEAMTAAAALDRLVVNEVVYAELSAGLTSLEETDAFIAAAGVSFVRISKQALFQAGRAFLRYRAAGGPRSGVLPDFFIGAHAAVEGAALLTRDARRYRTYFPTLELIAPN